MRKTFLLTGFCLMLFSLSVVSAYAAQAFCALHDGQPVDGKTVLEKQGKKYEFCCSGCLQQFKDAPEQFANELQPQTPAKTVSPEVACSDVCSD